MKIKLHTPVGYAGVMWPVGHELEIPDADAEAFKNYGIPVEEKAVKSGEKSCVERRESDASESKRPTGTSKKARSSKKK